MRPGTGLGGIMNRLGSRRTPAALLLITGLGLLGATPNRAERVELPVATGFHNRGTPASVAVPRSALSQAKQRPFVKRIEVAAGGGVVLFVIDRALAITHAVRDGELHFVGDDDLVYPVGAASQEVLTRSAAEGVRGTSQTATLRPDPTRPNHWLAEPPLVLGPAQLVLVRGRGDAGDQPAVQLAVEKAGSYPLPLRAGAPVSDWSTDFVDLRLDRPSSSWSLEAPPGVELDSVVVEWQGPTLAVRTPTSGWLFFGPGKAWDRRRGAQIRRDGLPAIDAGDDAVLVGNTGPIALTAADFEGAPALPGLTWPKGSTCPNLAPTWHTSPSAYVSAPLENGEVLRIGHRRIPRRPRPPVVTVYAQPTPPSEGLWLRHVQHPLPNWSMERATDLADDVMRAASVGLRCVGPPRTRTTALVPQISVGGRLEFSRTDGGWVVRDRRSQRLWFAEDRGFAAWVDATIAEAAGPREQVARMLKRCRGDPLAADLEGTILEGVVYLPSATGGTTRVQVHLSSTATGYRWGAFADPPQADTVQGTGSLDPSFVEAVVAAAGPIECQRSARWEPIGSHTSMPRYRGVLIPRSGTPWLIGSTHRAPFWVDSGQGAGRVSNRALGDAMSALLREVADQLPFPATTGPAEHREPQGRGREVGPPRPPRSLATPLTQEQDDGPVELSALLALAADPARLLIRIQHEATGGPLVVSLRAAGKLVRAVRVFDSQGQPVPASLLLVRGEEPRLSVDDPPDELWVTPGVGPPRSPDALVVHGQSVSRNSLPPDTATAKVQLYWGPQWSPEQGRPPRPRRPVPAPTCGLTGSATSNSRGSTGRRCASSRRGRRGTSWRFGPAPGSAPGGA